MTQLQYDERSTPAHRTALKSKKYKAQNGLCELCFIELPEEGKGAVLDRLSAPDGYTLENTRLLCKACDDRVQKSRNFG